MFGRVERWVLRFASPMRVEKRLTSSLCSKIRGKCNFGESYYFHGRIKSTFVKIFLLWECVPRLDSWVYIEEKISKNVDFSLWGKVIKVKCFTNWAAYNIDKQPKKFKKLKKIFIEFLELSDKNKFWKKNFVVK